MKHQEDNLKVQGALALPVLVPVLLAGPHSSPEWRHLTALSERRDGRGGVGWRRVVSFFARTPSLFGNCLELDFLIFRLATNAIEQVCYVHAGAWSETSRWAFVHALRGLTGFCCLLHVWNSA